MHGSGQMEGPIFLWWRFSLKILFIFQIGANVLVGTLGLNPRDDKFRASQHESVGIVSILLVINNILTSYLIN